MRLLRATSAIGSVSNAHLGTLMSGCRCALLIGFLGVLPMGCLGVSPEQQARDELGREPFIGGEEEDDDGGPEHRPGQPCLVCHGRRGNIGDAEFAVAGTVYLRATDPLGVAGAEVHIVDDAGWAFTATTNRTGNFMVAVSGDVSAAVATGDGRLLVPRPPVFPLTIGVRLGTEEQTMRSRAHREGSCAACHRAEIGTDTVDRIYLMEETP